jgi:hypothetical protein
VRKKLAENLPRTALFDSVAYTRNLEVAFAMMWERYRQGLPPASIRIATKSFAGFPPQG